MPKARRVRARPLADIAMLPTPERRQKGPIEPLPFPILDNIGELVRPLRAIDALTCLEREGVITRKERRAGDRFHDLFRIAAFDKLHAANPQRTPVVLAACVGRGEITGRVSEGNEAARLSVFGALDALGGISTPTASCAWYVLGLEMALRTWAQRVGWGGGRFVGPRQASGILIADLSILQTYFFA